MLLDILRSLGKPLPSRSSYTAMKRRKKALASRFNDQFDATVAYGLFKGMKLSTASWWGKSDRGSMLFGFYEEEYI